MLQIRRNTKYLFQPKVDMKCERGTPAHGHSVTVYTVVTANVVHFTVSNGWPQFSAGLGWTAEGYGRSLHPMLKFFRSPMILTKLERSDLNEPARPYPTMLNEEI